MGKTNLSKQTEQRPRFDAGQGIQIVALISQSIELTKDGIGLSRDTLFEARRFTVKINH